MKKIIIALLTVIAVFSPMAGQGSGQFTGDVSKFTAELTTFMGTLVSKPQKDEVNLFISLFDSTCYSAGVKDKIVNVASQLRGRRISQVPGFIFYCVHFLILSLPGRIRMR